MKTQLFICNLISSLFFRLYSYSTLILKGGNLLKKFSRETDMHGYSRYNIILFCLIFYWLAKKSVNFGGDDISVSVFHKTKSFFKVYYETTIMFCKKGWFWFNWKYIKHIICLICLGKHYIMKERVHQFLFFFNCIIIKWKHFWLFSAYLW